MISMAKLKKFVETRNASPHQTNLQFQIDANACGFKVDELGNVAKEGDAYWWAFMTKERNRVELIEQHGRLRYEVLSVAPPASART